MMIQARHIGILGLWLCSAALAQTGTENGEWRTYGGDLGHTRYAPLDQIDASNFGNLELAWRFSTVNMGPQPEYRFQSTPLMIDGVLYTTGGTRRAVTALDAGTGEQLWLYSLNEGERGANAPRRLSGRGLSFWTDGTQQRILYVTPGYRLIALDAGTGRPIRDFGDDGIVDLRDTLDQDVDFTVEPIGLHSPPTVAKNVVIVGAAHSPFAPAEFRSNVKGYIRGFDVVTGELLWTFHTVPRPGEPGYETWLDGSAEDAAGNAGVWARISVDEELELAYLPIESPYSDMYGGLRPGANLFGESIVAVDLHTGERRWHYQLAHHALWDHDIPTAPILVDAAKDGRTVKALAQPTKQGFLFVLDRQSGEPIWPIEEQPVPQGDVPGEWYSPTQPIPSISYGHQGVAIDDLIDFTPELRAEAERIVAEHRIGPIYTPAVLRTPEGPLSTLAVMGGSNWPGGAYDPETNIVYVTAAVSVNSMTICEYQEGSRLPFGICLGSDAGIFGGLRGLDVQGLPLLKPPYGTIAAIDLTKGEVIWEIPNGETPEQIRRHPALEGIDIGRTGRSGQPPGALATKSLLIVGEPGFGPTPDGRRGSMLRAYDKVSGEELAALQLPAPQSGSPMTYMHNGVQYLVIAVSGSGHPGELIAFRVPTSRAGDATTSRSTGENLLAGASSTVWAGVYTEEQAARGRAIYTNGCIECHGGSLEGVEMAPPLRGFNFALNWDGRSIADLMQQMRTMPPTEPSSLSYDEQLDVIAYMLSVGNFPVGSVALGQGSPVGQIRYTAVSPLD